MSDDNKEKPSPWDDEFELARRKERIYKETLHWIETDEYVQAWLKQFHPDSIRPAMERYAFRKARWITEKEKMQWFREHEGLKYKEQAVECLGNIQQKKLFDKQCLWRAEQFKHPAVETTMDFSYWEYNVLNCPFLDPITQEDIDLYIEYLETYTGEDLSFLGSWQDYDTYNSDMPTISKLMNKPPEENEEEEEDDEEDDREEGQRLMPPWYEFYNLRHGGSELLLLPDVRHSKELAYTPAAQAEEQKIYIEEHKNDPVDDRPHLWFSDEEDIKEFIEDFEIDPKAVMDAYHIYEDSGVEDDDAGIWEDLDEAWLMLSDCNEPFPIAQGITDWREALIVTARKWESSRVIKMLPAVYEEYLFTRQCGIQHPYNKEQAAFYRKLADGYKTKILRGRELKGEAGDLDF